MKYEHFFEDREYPAGWLRVILQVVVITGKKTSYSIAFRQIEYREGISLSIRKYTDCRGL